jgi:hypothetical protein
VGSRARAMVGIEKAPGGLVMPGEGLPGAIALGIVCARRHNQVRASDEAEDIGCPDPL